MTLRLDELEVLGGLDADQRDALTQILRDRTLDAGAPLFAQGDAAKSCFLILDGEVVVDLDVEGRGSERVSTLRRGDLFGEVALLDGQPRSASCSAGPSGARVAELARADFDRLFNAGDALAHAVMDIVLDRLVRRLRGATQLLLDVAQR